MWLFEQGAQSGGEKSLQQVATKTLPKLREHLQLAKEIATKVGADTTGMSAHAERESGTR